MTLEELTAVMKQNGVCGAGGAGFPSYAKLDKRADTIILNCAECEPLLKLHRQVLAQHAYEIMNTLAKMAALVDAERVIIAVKASYHEAVQAVEANLPSFPVISIGLLPEIYPAGDEVITIYETTGRVVPPGQLPISMGVCVFNVETIYNVSRALDEKKPVTHKYITVAGAVRHPSTYLAPLGMSYQELIDLAGGAAVERPALIAGGPMTGVLCQPFDVVTKTSNAVLVLPDNHPMIVSRQANASIDLKRAMSVCCQCQMCTDLCPRHLLGHPIQPHALMRAASCGQPQDQSAFLNTMFCSQCGLCEYYACMQGLSPRKLIGTFRNALRKNGVTPPKGVEAAPTAPDRDVRRVPMSRLTARLGLAPYNVPAPLSDCPVETKLVKIKLSQHIGAPAKAVVQIGDTVREGQLIGEIEEGKLGVPVHASLAGTVREVTDQYVVIAKA